MRIEILNWGPIQRCEYDLDKSLIVTYGENNIGKSYAMQVVYLLLKNMRNFVDMRIHLGKYFSELDIEEKVIEEVVKDFSMEKTYSKEITGLVLSEYEKILENFLLKEFRASLRNTFGTYEKMIDHNPKITLDVGEGSNYVLLLKDNKVKADIDTKKVYLKKTTSEFHKSRNYKEHYDIYVKDNLISTPIKLVRQRISDLTKEFVMDFRKWMRAVYFLPASRSGIYTGMSSFGPIMAQLSQNRAFFNRSFQIPNIPEPISDYYMELSSIKADKSLKFEEFAQEIEQSILKGEVKFDNKQKALVYQGEATEQSLEMNDVSSMVSEISPIVGYLKFIIKTGYSQNGKVSPVDKDAVSIIFIEEPEAHLHPLNQIKLMKTFAKFSKSNIKLIIASHSNYIFNELNNRVIAGDLNKDTYSPIVMKMENGKSNTYYMDMDEFGVRDTNFADAAELLYDEREDLVMELMERLENEN